VISSGIFLYPNIVKLEADRNSAFPRSLLRVGTCQEVDGRSNRPGAATFWFWELLAPASWHLPSRNYFFSAEKLTPGNCELPFLTEARSHL